MGENIFNRNKLHGYVYLVQDKMNPRTSQECLAMAIGEGIIELTMKSIVIYDQIVRRYFHFTSYETLAKYYPLNSYHNIHEVILNWRPIKFYMDIDNYENNNMLDDLRFAVEMVFMKYNMQSNPPDVHICESIGFDNITGKLKNSAHLVVGNFSISGDGYCKKIAEEVLANLNEEDRKFVDMGVYSKNHLFRTVGSIKNGRRFEIPNGITRQECMITVCPDTLIPFEINNLGIPNHKRYKIKEIENAQKQEIIDQLAHLLPGWKFRNWNDNYINYDRDGAPTLCKFCNTNHDADNSTYVRIEGNNFYERCRKCRTSNKCVLLLAINGDVNEPVKMEFTEFIETYQYYQSTIYDEIKMKPIEITNAQYIYLRAQMKMGKTQIAIKFLTQFAMILVVSCRRSFTREKLRELSPLGFKSYADINGKIDMNKIPRLIIQLDSLHRLTNNFIPDLIVLDESESLVEQFSSATLKSPSYIYNKLSYLIKNAVVLCMDARLSHKTVNLIRDANPDAINKEHMIWNKYKNNVDDTIFMIKNKACFIKCGFNLVQKGQNIIVATNSVKLGKSFEKMLIKQKILKPEEIKLIYAGISEKEKDDIFQDVNAEWVKYKCVIYTPTCGAGISFTEKHFDSCLCYFTNSSNTVQSQLQMMYRVRDISTKNYYVCLESHEKGGLITEEQIDNFFSSADIKHLGNISDLEPTGTDNFGNRIYNKLSKIYRLLRLNYIEANLSENKHVDLFTNLCWQTGAKIRKLVEFDEEIQNEIGKLIQYAQIAIKKEDAKHLVNAPEYTRDEYENTQVVADKIDYARRKYEIRDGYNYKGILNEKLAIQICEQSSFDKFRHLQTMLSSKDINISIKYADSLTKNDSPFPSDYPKYVLSKKILNLCGFDHIVDTKIIKRNDLINNTMNSKKKFDELETHIAMIFKKKRPKIWEMRQILAYLNSIFDEMYGFKIKATTTGNKRFIIKHKFYNNVISSVCCKDRPYIELDWKYKKNEEGGFEAFEF